jgi:hypothetical protein
MSTASKLLPSLAPASSLIIGDGETFVTCAGFEERALTGAGCAMFNSGGRAVLLEYLPQNPKNQGLQLEEMFRRAGARSVRSVIYDRFAPKDFARDLANLLAETTAVVLDISAMSKLAIILCLKVCESVGVAVTMFYAEAEEYGPSEEEYQDKRAQVATIRPTMRMDAGVYGVIRTRETSSVAMQGQPNAAIAFMSFNERLTQALVNSVNPGRLFLINGIPPTLRWREEATAWIHEQLRSEWPDDDNPVANGLPVRATSTLDYRETVDVLLDLYWELASNHRVIIAPTGSKMQAVACYLAHALHPDIQIEYPTPEGFLDLYSRGVGRTWVLTLGPLGQAIRQWSDQEQANRLLIRA